jgi:hypothetical protein
VDPDKAGRWHAPRRLLHHTSPREAAHDLNHSVFASFTRPPSMRRILVGLEVVRPRCTAGAPPRPRLRSTAPRTGRNKAKQANDQRIPSLRGSPTQIRGMGKRVCTTDTAPLTTNGSAPHTATPPAAGIAIDGLAAGGNWARRPRVRGARGRRVPRRQDLSLSRMRSRNPFRHCACGGVAGGLTAFGGADDRRHWHTPCWANRATRGPTRKWS